MAIGLDIEHTEAVVLVEERDSLYQAGKALDQEPHLDFDGANKTA